ncbi:MAG TPA: protein kinase [Pyrinomonadaceae bacterium]|nr:protein kinase [Pyrinomonadaceae bacterium]
MNPERWQQIDSLFDTALDHAPAARAAFLCATCPDDEELRGEVEALLIAHGQTGDFIEAPALDVAARLFADDEDAPAEDKDTLAAGESIGRYEVESLLGAGGMGEVYLARDTALDRPVALKLLPARLAGEQDRLRRFEREARTVSKLNHPNILTIHEIGHTDSLHFIATEFIDGVTLRQRLKAGRMKVDEILNIAIQTASALSAAHEAGIVHRDIKPENIMIRRDGYVKVLDFGIAKFTSHEHPAAGSEAATERLFKTQAGLVIGTARYMSPEQSRGQTLDAGTDIWSLGVVLYEMCAARVPFDGATPSDVLVAILDREPPALSLVAGYVPAELERIVSKALRKDRAERYGNVGEMALELESLRQQLKLQPEQERPATALDQPTALLPAEPTESETVTRLSPAAREPSQPSQPGHPRGKKHALLLVAVVVLLLLAAGMLALRDRQPAAPAATPHAAATAPTERALNYSLLVQKYRDDKPYQQPFKLGGEINFERDYRVRLYVSSPQEGYLYILNERPAAEGADASFNVMFPSPNANGGAARLTPDQEIQIPGQGWFRFDEEEGTELIWLVWAAESQPELEALKRFVNPEDRGMITDAGQARAVREFLRTHSAAQPSVEKDEARRETSVRAKGGILAHVVRLQHH